MISLVLSELGVSYQLIAIHLLMHEYKRSDTEYKVTHEMRLVDEG